MLSKKYYLLIAGSIKNQLAINTHTPREVAAEYILHGIAQDLAEQFQEDNPRFDADKFMTATGTAQRMEQ